MSGIVPVVRYFVICERVITDPSQSHRHTLAGLISHLHPTEDPPFPFRQPEMCAFLQVTGSRGSGQGRIEIVHTDSDRRVFRSSNVTLSFAANPLAVQTVTFRLRNCAFPEAGLYEVQFWYNDTLLAQQPILVK